MPGYSSCVGGRTEIKRIVAADDMGKSMVGQTAVDLEKHPNCTNLSNP